MDCPHSASKFLRQRMSAEKGAVADIRLAVFGSGKVGKTSIVKQYLFNTFEERYFETIEEIYQQDVLYDHQPVELTIVDTAGNYQFPAMRELTIKQSNGFILVYAIDNVASFQDALRTYEVIKLVKNTENVPVILVGNKTDSGFRRVQRVEASSAMKLWGSKVQHIETSAKRGWNINLLFNSLIGMIDEQHNENMEMNCFRDMSRSRFSSVRASVRRSTRVASRSFSSVRRSSKPPPPVLNDRKVGASEKHCFERLLEELANARFNTDSAL